MKENTLAIVINRPAADVFEFIIDPKNTPCWIPSILEESAEPFPPKLGTLYRNRGAKTQWSSYRVTEFVQGRLFALSGAEGNYLVQYCCRELEGGRTRLTYAESVRNGELAQPFTMEILLRLKSLLETPP